MELKEGENCWRVSRIERGAFLLSGQAYFRAFRQALIRAERAVYILAWDLSEKIEMVRDEADDDGYPSGLADFIFAILEEKPELQIHILLWDYSMVYLAEREWLPFTRWRQEKHPRLHLELDDALNVGASHHQKVVVVDEALAFFGGFDLSAWRWDAPEHEPDDPRRKNPKNEPYQPYHDIQVLVEGPMVDDLAELCAMRWKRATGDELPRMPEKPGDGSGGRWPEGMQVDLENETAALALTFSRYKEYEPSRHIERLHLELIEEAEDYIYIENQYLSSHTIVEALAQRLKEADGPEIILILTRDTGGWIEEGTMGVLRDRLLEILKEADRHDRFGAYYPFVEDEDGHSSQVYVHAKLMIVDDRVIEVGSANLSNRSMKVDSELDLVVVKDAPAGCVTSLLERLLAMHFQVSTETVRERRDGNASLIAAVEGLRDGRLHRLEHLEIGCNNRLQRKIADTQLLDPDEPISPAYWMRELLRDQLEARGPDRFWRRTWVKVAAFVALGLLLAYGLKEAWGDVITKDAVVAYFEGFRNSPYALPILLGVFVLAGLIAVPVNLLLVAGTIVMGPWVAFGCGLAGSLASAALAFAAGHGVGKPLIRLLAKDQLESLARTVGRRGPLSVALIRIVPIAPFVVINLVAGFSGLRFSTFMLGSVMGMVPGMLAVVLLTRQIRSALADPSWRTWLVLGLLVAAVGAAAVYLKKKFRRGV
ncbi:MAG: VTT domain-containing protein [Verrucomicrobiota bacterium]